ncbi:MAG: hypothetical protein R6V85_12280 [Polyangia bacterium]
MARSFAAFRSPAKTALLVAALLSICPPSRSDEADQGREASLVRRAFSRGLEAIVDPLRAEAGPVISPALSPIPKTAISAGAGFSLGEWSRGRARYRRASTRLVLGGEWSPSGFDRLGLGGELVALQTSTLGTRVPPAIDERRTFADLGPLRIHGRMVAYRLEHDWLAVALTPFLRLGFPTDTSRIRPDHHIALRYVIDDRVFLSPLFLVEPGITAGAALGPVSFYTHQGPIAAVIHDERFHFLWSMHYGAGIELFHLVEVACELGGLLRGTEDFRGERWKGWAVSPGARLLLEEISIELSSRFGVISKGSVHAHGDFTLFLGITWELSEITGEPKSEVQG